MYLGKTGITNIDIEIPLSQYSVNTSYRHTSMYSACSAGQNMEVFQIAELPIPILSHMDKYVRMHDPWLTNYVSSPLVYPRTI